MLAGLFSMSGILLLCGDPPACPPEPDDDPAAFSVWVRGEYWYANPTGQIVITRGSRPGSGGLVRVGEDFGLRSTGVPGGEIGASLGDHRVKIDYLHLYFDGHDELDDTLVFHGETYPAGEQIKSHVDLPRLSIGYDYDVWDTPWTKLRVGVVAHVYWFSARLTSATLDEKRAYSRGTAAAAATVEIPLGFALASLDGSLGYSDSDHEFFGGIRLLVAAKVWGPLEVGAGFRWERMNASAETNQVAVTVHGPLLEVTVRF